MRTRRKPRPRLLHLDMAVILHPVDYQRGIVTWDRSAAYAASPTYGAWIGGFPISADALSYNAVFLQYLPLDKALLGLDTVRLPLDGQVSIFRAGDLVREGHSIGDLMTMDGAVTPVTSFARDGILIGLRSDPVVHTGERLAFVAWDWADMTSSPALSH